MDAVAQSRSAPGLRALGRSAAAGLALFAGTMFLSALLLFSVQPMFAKMVLPHLGGSPSVWAVSMVFFQAALLAGYCYAHLLNRHVPARIAPIAHLSLLAVAALTLPVGLPTAWTDPPAGDAYLWLIGALAVGVGLPFFAISASAPLLQSWFARTGHPHADDPYFLYGASNLGSLLALLAYPFLIEPNAGLVHQARIWAGGFLLLVLAIAACGLAMLAHLWGSAATTAPCGHAASPAASPAWRERLAWIGLAAVPSGLLVAFTSFVSTDIASAPFLWVIPLAMFLLTFILVFKDKPVIPHDWPLLHPVLVGIVLLGMTLPGNQGWTLVLVTGTAAFFLTTIVAHRELYERRPASGHLTEFYLWMSLGGVLGGMFAALLAPRIFSVIWEFPLLLVLGLLCRPGMFRRPATVAEVKRCALVACLVIVAISALAHAMQAGLVSSGLLPRLVVFGALAFAAVFLTRDIHHQAGLVALMGAALLLLPSAMTRGDAERSFFGVHRIAVSTDRQTRLLMHGTTLHGAERILDGAGKAIAAPTPATYYYPEGPMARGVEAARIATGKRDGGLSVGMVGLGAGSMACYARPGEAWRFYEIDPVVARIARDPARFSFLSRCQPDAKIVLGDARLTLAREPAGLFDYLIIDAFSSDAVPVHLLTVEAVRLYLGRLSANGILAMHVSNRHLDLVDVVAAVIREIPGIHALLADDGVTDKGFDRATSHVVFITKSKEAMEPVRVLPYMVAMPASGTRAWTDDYSDILGAILRKRR